jgi:hypothetical protein
MAAGIAWCAGVVALSVASLGSKAWIDFVRAAPHVRTFGFYRDNSFASALQATAHVLGVECAAAASAGGLLLGVGVLLAVAARTGFRWTWIPRMPAPNGAIERHFPAVLFAMCLLSPLLWEHHWVWAALPCVLVANAAIANGGGMKSSIGTLLIFFVPTFDAFPFSYHRLAGALLVMADVLPASPRAAAERG